jgi:NodT family efflux transporter outer membrane factor (OMF) lipoprotein
VSDRSASRTRPADYRIPRPEPRIGALQCFTLAALCVVAVSCAVGPNYQRPVSSPPAAFKELSGADSVTPWKTAAPADDRLRTSWWEVYDDPILNELEGRVALANQNVAEVEARFRAARAAIRGARADLYPTIGVDGTVKGSHAPSGSRPAGSSSSDTSSSGSSTGTDTRGSSSAADQIAADFTYELDVWGRIRRDIEASVASAQASAADVQTALLSLCAELASDYFQLRGLDRERQLFDRTIASYERALQININRANQGIASGIDVAEARTQLSAARAQALELGVTRALFEHAIAMLTGQPPALLSIEPNTAETAPPAVPVAFPSVLLERRPDIAAAERRVAAANARIGIATAAYFPTVDVSGAAGVATSVLSELFSAPSRFWSLGPSLAATIFDGGRRRANRPRPPTMRRLLSIVKVS